MHEDELWTMKGQYSTAVKDENPITWGFITYNFKDLFTFIKDKEKEGGRAEAKPKKGKEKVKDASISGSGGGKKRGDKKKK